MDTSWVIVGLFVLIGVLVAVILLLARGYVRQAADFMTAMNNSPTLKDSIEYAAQGVPARTVNAFIGFMSGAFNLLIPALYAGNEEKQAEAMRLLKEAEKFGKDVTDGLPNTADGGEVVAKG